jgi:hypothetical protein
MSPIRIYLINPITSIKKSTKLEISLVRVFEYEKISREKK